MRRDTAVVLALFLGGAALRAAFMVLYRPGFLGISDSGSYIFAASHGLFSDVYDTAGYPLLIRGLHVVYPHLALLILAQHALGLATAALMYLAVRRVTGSPLPGLVPAGILLYDGYALWVEHTPLTEPLFAFLLALSLLLCLRSGERPAPLVGAGAGLGLAVTVRPVALVALLICAAWGRGRCRGGCARACWPAPRSSCPRW